MAEACVSQNDLITVGILAFTKTRLLEMITIARLPESADILKQENSDNGSPR